MTSKNYEKRVNDGVSFKTINGVRILYSTFRQVTAIRDDDGEHESYNAYIENKIWKTALACAVFGVKKRLEITASPFYFDLLNDIYICYAFDRNAQYICDRIRELENSKKVVCDMLRKTSDTALITARRRLTDTINALEKYRLDGNGNGNGHDVIMCAYEAIRERIIKKGVWFNGTPILHDGDGDGNDDSLFKTGARAVHAYIYALKKRNDEMANNDDGNGDDDDDEKKTAVETYAYIENFDFETLDEFYKKYNIIDDFERAICERIVNGDSITKISKYFKTSRVTIYKHLNKIKLMMRAVRD